MSLLDGECGAGVKRETALRPLAPQCRSVARSRSRVEAPVNALACVPRRRPTASLF
jgi:hypothetical protein